MGWVGRCQGKGQGRAFFTVGEEDKMMKKDMHLVFLSSNLSTHTGVGLRLKTSAKRILDSDYVSRSREDRGNRHWVSIRLFPLTPSFSVVQSSSS